LPSTAFLVLMSDSLIGSQFFFDPKPWLALTFALTLVFVIVWLPWIRGLTNSIAQMTKATSRIAEGQFDTELRINRRDEVGHLASSINRMSTQLSRFVKGQKRFLADIAHELCAPTARMQLGLGILEQRTNESTRECVADIMDDVRHMSELINELLSFSRAGMQPADTEMTRVEVADTVRRVLEREGTPDARIEASVTADVTVLANPDYLFRALSNLVRNAIRYAGHAGPISVSARKDGRETVITVADHGPGVPEGALEEVFAPFFRLEQSRGRDSGGTGLGLAIVKACIEACKGTVRAHNRRPSGLEVEIRLPAA
jgi:two-component system sensor histidine kinase CpxA